jgi:hypothetical protein
MKKLLLSFILLVVFAPSAYSYADWQIPSINQEIEIQKSGKLHITETIVADFTNDPHHGIYREIPVKYKDKFGNRFNLRLDILSVTDENGNPHNIHEQGVDFLSDDYHLKIGDPDIYVSEETTYVIEYEVQRALNYFGQHDELYWNIFTDWEVPVLESAATVKLPENMPVEALKATCFTGYYGSTEKNCTAEIEDEKTITFTTNNTLNAGQGFTIVAGFTPDIINEPSLFQEILWFLLDNWVLLIPVLVFLFLFLKWWYTGRDPHTKDTIIPIYEPPDNLTPTEVGTLIDEKIDTHDISTVIIDYAVQGYIKIKEIKTKKLIFFDETDYQLSLIKDYKNKKGIKSHEKEILNNVFDGKEKVKISDLRLKFYKHLKDIKKKLYKNLVKDGYFVHNPENVRGIYFSIGIALTVIPLFVIAPLITIFGITAVISVILSGVLFIVFSRIMPRKTLKGANAFYKIKGLEEYIRTAEKDRIKFYEDKNIFFEKLLPYAMVLQLSEKWAKAFEDIYKKPPAWFESSGMDRFNTYYLVDRLNHFSSTTNTAFASSPRSSGSSSAWGGGSGFSGGFSGGGFGGGGGGGW